MVIGRLVDLPEKCSESANHSPETGSLVPVRFVSVSFGQFSSFCHEMKIEMKWKQTERNRFINPSLFCFRLPPLQVQACQWYNWTYIHLLLVSITFGVHYALPFSLHAGAACDLLIKWKK